jgi:beta-galactosidase
VPGTFIENVFARPENVLTTPTLRVDCHIQHLEASRQPLTLEVELRDGGSVVAKNTMRIERSPAAAEPMAHTVQLQNLSGIKLWDLANPFLYQVRVNLLQGTTVLDEDTRSIGFRRADFTDHGF